MRHTRLSSLEGEIYVLRVASAYHRPWHVESEFSINLTPDPKGVVERGSSPHVCKVLHLNNASEDVPPVTYNPRRRSKQYYSSVQSGKLC